MTLITATANALRTSARKPAALRSSVAFMSTNGKPGPERGDVPSPTKKDALKQGHAADPKNLHQKDVESQSVRGGMGTKARSEQDRAYGKGGEEELDAAAEGKSRPKPKDTGSGNPEGIGFVEQVGSGSGSAKHFEK